MRSSVVRALLIIAFLSAFCAVTPAQVVTMYAPMNPETKKYNEGKSCFNFKLGLVKEATKGNQDWDLGYGFLAIDNQDWFVLHYGDENRSVIKDLGELKWEDPLNIPILEPLPPVEKGQHRQITIDSSGDTHKAWAQSVPNFAKVFLGHIYLMRVKNEIEDFYVMFRVEDFEQRKRCAISWRLAPSRRP
jgi:hypothetical protein